MAILANEYEFIDNGILLDAALDAEHFPDADLLSPNDRMSTLLGLTSDDVHDLAVLTFTPDRVEVIRRTS